MFRKFKGIITALVTPLRENGQVDIDQFVRLINIQIKAGIGGLLILGGTGEYTALSTEVRKKVAEIAVNEVNGRIPVIIGNLEPGIGESIKFCRHIKEVGADAALVLTPFYVHPSQQGIIDFYQKIATEVDMPIMIYDIPYRTSVSVEPETYEKLAAVKNIVGLKDCSTSLGQAIELIDKVGDKIAVLNGEDYIAVYSFIMGSPGAIVASSNLIPKEWVKIYNLTQEKKYDEAVNLHKKYYYLMKGIFTEVNPGPLKYAMNRCGLFCGKPSIPLLEPTSETKELIDNLLAKYNLL